MYSNEYYNGLAVNFNKFYRET